MCHLLHITLHHQLYKRYHPNVPGLSATFSGIFHCWLTGHRAVSSSKTIQTMFGKLSACSTLGPAHNARMHSRDLSLKTLLLSSVVAKYLQALVDCNVPSFKHYSEISDRCRFCDFQTSLW